MIKEEEVYKIGRIGKAHGVKGELSFQIQDDVFDRVDADFLILEIDGILVPFFIEEYRFRNDNVVLMKFEDVDTEQRARELTGSDVYFLRQLAEGEDEVMTWAEIVGFAIVDAGSNRQIGKVSGVNDATINTLFEVTTAEGDELLIPANEDMIVEVDKNKNEIIMTIPDGLLSL